MSDEKRTLPKVPKTAGAPMPWEPSGKPKKFKRAGFVIDLRRCVGCHACSVSCKTEHDVALGVFRTRVRYVEQPKKTPARLRADVVHALPGRAVHSGLPDRLDQEGAGRARARGREDV